MTVEQVFLEFFVRHLREVCDDVDARVAEEFGIPRQHVAGILAGKRYVSPKTIDSFAERHGRTASQMLEALFELANDLEGKARLQRARFPLPGDATKRGEVFDKTVAENLHGGKPPSAGKKRRGRKAKEPSREPPAAPDEASKRPPSRDS